MASLFWRRDARIENGNHFRKVKFPGIFRIVYWSLLPVATLLAFISLAISVYLRLMIRYICPFEWPLQQGHGYDILYGCWHVFGSRSFIPVPTGGSCWSPANVPANPAACTLIIIIILPCIDIRIDTRYSSCHQCVSFICLRDCIYIRLETQWYQLPM